MTERRTERINRLLEKELAEILRQETAKTSGLMVSVSAVRTSADLSTARVFISVFPSGRGKEIIGNISSRAGEVRSALAEKVRHQLRILPSLLFELDDTIDQMERIGQLLDRH